MIIQRDSKHVTSEAGSALAKIFLLYGEGTFNTVRLNQSEFIKVIAEANSYITNKHHTGNKLTRFQVIGYPIDFVLDENL